MADLEVWKKYPLEGEEGDDSYRLDHPHFQNVQRTTFAKGVITDFKKVSEDPIEVESMVKVEIEGYGESDYIPLFYHPKAQYWDTDDYEAIDFDEDNKCFKAAWMSFRGGDEVVVLMQAEAGSSDLRPKYVLGFVDNYPRIGEDILKSECPEDGTLFYQFTVDSSYDDGDTGPDGFDLKLVTEVDLGLWTESWNESGFRCPTYKNFCNTWSGVLLPSGASAATTDWAYNFAITFGVLVCWSPIGGSYGVDHYPTDPFWSESDQAALDVCESHGFSFEDGALSESVTLKQGYQSIDWTAKVKAYYIIIGPIIYVAFVAYESEKRYRKMRYYHSERDDISPPDGNAYYLDLRDFMIAWTQDENGYGTADISTLGFGPDEVCDDFEENFEATDVISAIQVMAGVYTDELLESVKGLNISARDSNYEIYYGDYTNWVRPQVNIDGLVLQTEKYDDFPWYSLSELDCVGYVRPHTKEELIEAGLLNADGSLPEE